MQIHIGAKAFRHSKNPETGDVLLTFAEPTGASVVAHIEASKWDQFVAFVNDPEGVAEQHSARSRLVLPDTEVRR